MENTSSDLLINNCKEQKDLSALHGELNDRGAWWICAGYGQCVCTDSRTSRWSIDARNEHDK